MALLAAFYGTAYAQEVRIGPDASIYAALIADHLKGGGVAGAIVEDTGLSWPASRPGRGEVPSPHVVASWELATNLDGVPKALRDAMEAAESMPAPVFNASMFPAQVRVVATATINALFAGPVLDGWAAFRKAFGDDSLYAFSTIVTASDRRDALVYEQWSCDLRCAVGAYVWLHRDSLADPWAVQGRYRRWIS